MYYTLTIIDGQNELTDHPTLDDAQMFARDVADEGYDCSVLRVVSSIEGREQVGNMADYYGVRAGIDFPATL